MREKQTVTVCSSCLRASCWQGEMMCGVYHGTRQMKISELAKLGRENPEWWDIDPATGCARFLNSQAAMSHGEDSKHA